jgi:acyl carrier protein
MAEGRDEIVKSITEHLYQVIPDAQGMEISENRDLGEFPSFDSLGILEALVWLEGRFSVTIPDEDLVVDRFKSVGKMADYVVANRR